jgi:hypothetical protein
MENKTDNIIAVVVEGEVTHVLGVDDSFLAALMSNPSFYSLEGVEEEILPGRYYDRFNKDLSQE